MNVFRTATRIGLVAAAVALRSQAAEADSGTGAELNLWPFAVKKEAGSGRQSFEEHLGPLFFSTEKADGEKVMGFRPLYVSRTKNQSCDTTYLYPIFQTHDDKDSSSWSLFNLINFENPKKAPTAGEPRNFDVWPFYFSRRTGEPGGSYTALVPFGGTIKNRFGSERIDFVLLPFYGRFQQGQKVVRTMPWPFIKTIEGGGHRGWAVWPLAGWREETGKSRSQFYLWPLIYRVDSRLDEKTPAVSAGFLPFYAMEHSAETDSQTFLWPFIGYTERKVPYRYTQHDYLWPFLVQGRGDDRYRNRWAPFYSHSMIKGTGKTWVLWPLFRQQTWSEGGLDQCKTQIAFFFYWSLQQRRPGSPENAPYAHKTHIWPLLSAWDNGAGRGQVQIFSPFEVFFPTNDAVRDSYSPLFALYRYDQRAPGNVRQSILWNAVTIEKNESAGSRAVHIGPLLSFEKDKSSARLALLCGLLGVQQQPGHKSWRPFAFDFTHRAAKPAPQS